MDKQFRQRVIEAIQRGEELPAEWARELFPPEKREYELVYHGKEREEDILADTMALPLQPVRTFGTNGNGWANMLILGDNLQAMKYLLLMKDRGELTSADGTLGVRLVYIDPPFATKREFSGTRDQKAYQDKIAGAQFVEFVRKRLVLLRELLADDGSVFVHLDWRKCHYVKTVLDEVFVESNFRNEIILPGRASKNLQQQFGAVSRLNVRHDTLLWYSRGEKARFSPLWVEKHKASNPEGHWHHFWSTADRRTMRYKLFGIKPETGQWTWKQERAKCAVENYKRFQEEAGGRTLAEYWRDTGCALEFIRKNPEDGTPQYWRAPAELRLADTMWSGIPIYNNSTGYPTEKNETLLSQVLELASSKGDLVLDAFAGSGTTCAVAEKMGRRWIGIDCGKLSIYTIQKRMLSLRQEIGNKGETLKPKPFTLYNAGLYDFSRLKELDWERWRWFALQLFNCRDEPHTIGGLSLDGKFRGASVLVFNHMAQPGIRIDEKTILELHAHLKGRIGDKFFIIAPRGVFDFQQDYIDLGGVRYYALRIPYSVIKELHRRDFSALQQPNDEMAVNDTVDAVGFDFIQPPEVKFTVRVKKPKGQLLKAAYLKIASFETHARIRGEDRRAGKEALSMLMLDFNYDGEVFDLDKVLYGSQLQSEGWQATFAAEGLGAQVMAVFIDIYGNELCVVIPREDFGISRKATRRARKAKA